MIKKTLGILFKLFLICFFSIVVFYTGLSFFGLWTIARLAHEENTRSEAEKKYIAANTPPKPVEIKIEGCPSGYWNTKLYGYVEVLDTKIEVPCSLSNGKYYLVKRQFFIDWSDEFSTLNKKLNYKIGLRGVSDPLKPPLFLSDNTLTPVGAANTIIRRTPTRFGPQTVSFYCDVSSCRGWMLLSPNVYATVVLHNPSFNMAEHLKDLVDQISSKVK